MSERRIELSVPVIGDHELEYVKKCLDEGWVSTSGEFIGLFEAGVEAATGSPYAVGCQSGTAAIHVALQLAGVGRDDEVIVPAITFIATVNPVRYLCAHPVFVDCDEYMNMSPESVRSFLEEACELRDGKVYDRETGRRVAAILPVHVFGNPCDMTSLAGIAAEFGLPLVEDAAESLGSSWTEGPLAGRHTGTVGLLGTLSFNANKIITTGGGGMILTGERELADRARYLTTQAKDDHLRYKHGDVGYNYRLTNIAAALGVAQLETLGDRIEAKKRNHDLYAELLADVPGVSILPPPPGTAPNYWFHSAIIESEEYGRDREELMLALEERGIATRPVWFLNHKQKPYVHDRAWRIERAEWFFERVLNVPSTHTLSREDVEYVCSAIAELGPGRP